MNVGNVLMGVTCGVGLYFAAIYIVPAVLPYIPAEYWPSWMSTTPTVPTIPSE